MNRANDELMTQVGTLEEMLRVKRHQMKVAKSAHKAGGLHKFLNPWVKRLRLTHGFRKASGFNRA